MVDQDDATRVEILADIRRLYATGDYDGVAGAFGRLEDLNSIRSNIRIEAIALAARALVATGDPTGARAVIKPVWKQPMKNHRHYRYLAQVCLELGEYDRAASLANAAAGLKQQENDARMAAAEALGETSGA
jgi:predicted Zn-dependent protease